MKSMTGSLESGLVPVGRHMLSERQSSLGGGDGKAGTSCGQMSPNSMAGRIPCHAVFDTGGCHRFAPAVLSPYGTPRNTSTDRLATLTRMPHTSPAAVFTGPTVH